jgi:hypothetical protein
MDHERAAEQSKLASVGATDRHQRHELIAGDRQLWLRADRLRASSPTSRCLDRSPSLR